MFEDAPIIDTTIPQTARDLLKRLEAECPELLLLVKSAPIRLVGKQRTGKSTFAKKLVLLRSILLPGHRVAWATPHRELDNPVPDSLNPFGTTPDGAKYFEAIEAVWKAVQGTINKGRILNTSLIWDEFGSYDEFQDEQALGKSLRSLLRESSKHQYYPILIAHGDQAIFYPGGKGILATLQESTVKVETIGAIANAFGEMKPTGFVEVTQLDGSQTRFKVPDWLTVDLLLTLQPATSKPTVLDEIALVKSKHQKPTTVGYSNEFETEEVMNQSNEDSIQQRVTRKIIDKIKSANGAWVKQKDLVVNTFSQPKDRETAKQLLKIAVSRGILEHEKVINPNNTETIRYRVKVGSTNINSQSSGSKDGVTETPSNRDVPF